MKLPDLGAVFVICDEGLLGNLTKILPKLKSYLGVFMKYENSCNTDERILPCR
jgi:hypothetical protein